MPKRNEKRTHRAEPNSIPPECTVTLYSGGRIAAPGLDELDAGRCPFAEGLDGPDNGGLSSLVNTTG
jgi:hypothetical protein